MKYLKICFAILVSISSMAQNPYWAIPPKYVDFTDISNPVKTLPWSLTQQRSANGIFHDNGTLKFFTGGYSNIADRTRVQPMPLTALNGTVETAIIPLPNTCNTYLSLVVTDGPLCICGISPSCDPTTCGNGYILTPGLIKYNSTTGVVDAQDLWSGIPPVQGLYDKFFSSNVGIAVGRIQELATVPTSKVYIVGQKKINNVLTNQIIQYNVTSTGFSSTSVLYSSTANTIVTATTEADLSADGKYLGWGDLSGNVYVYNTTLPVSVSNPMKIATVATNKIMGVEFSKTGDTLFFAKKATIPANSSISGVLSATGAPVPDVAGSSDIANSQLELAIDGKIYGSNGSQLKGFVPSGPQLGIQRTINSIVISSNIYSGGYSLPDQIDGANYRKLFSYSTLSSGTPCQSDLVLTGNLSGTYQAANTITTQDATNSATGQVVELKAGARIDLNQGFIADAGTNFKAQLEVCGSQVLTIVDPCGIGQNREGDFAIENAVPINGASSICYPNPISNGYVHFDRKYTQVKIIDGFGKTAFSASNVDKINVDLLPKGVYILHFDENTEKLIVQ